jgi:hypothetical protein
MSAPTEPIGLLTVLLALVLLLMVALAAYGAYHSVLREDVWSISIYDGDDPLHLQPLAPGPVLTARDVADAASLFVADPFLVRDGDGWLMFFESLEKATRRGVIGVAASADGVHWRHQRIVLREPFHLSYPQVFDWKGVHYMLPESGEAGAVRLYRAERFPDQWRLERELLRGTYWDATVVMHDGRWWLFAAQQSGSLCLFHADDLLGPWQPHPANPVVSADPHRSRPAGRMLVHEGRLLRVAQDGIPTYGSSVRVMQVDDLSTTNYREHEIAGSPVLRGSGAGWNMTGMHHLDAQRLESGRWLAAVDGNRQRRVFNWRAGARRILDSVM